MRNMDKLLFIESHTISDLSWRFYRKRILAQEISEVTKGLICFKIMINSSLQLFRIFKSLCWKSTNLSMMDRDLSILEDSIQLLGFKCLIGNWLELKICHRFTTISEVIMSPAFIDIIFKRNNPSCLKKDFSNSRRRLSLLSLFSMISLRTRNFFENFELLRLVLILHIQIHILIIVRRTPMNIQQHKKIYIRSFNMFTGRTHWATTVFVAPKWRILAKQNPTRGKTNESCQSLPHMMLLTIPQPNIVFEGYSDSPRNFCIKYNCIRPFIR